VTGDDVICRLATDRLGAVTVAVKHSEGWTAANSLHPTRACEAIRHAPSEVVSRPSRFEPAAIPDRLVVDVRMQHPNAARVAALVRGAEQTDTFGVRLEASSPAELLGVVSIWSDLAMKHSRD